MRELFATYAHFILNNRFKTLLVLSFFVIGITYQAAHVKISHYLPRLLSNTNSAVIQHDEFRKTFGDDGTVMVLGVETTRMYELTFFQSWYDLSENIRAIQGIKDVVSNIHLQKINKNEEKKTLTLEKILLKKPTSIAEVDSFRKEIQHLPVYKGLFFSEDEKAHVMLITFDKSVIDSQKRIDIVRMIQEKAAIFEVRHRVKIHFSGMPFIRTETTALARGEFVKFSLLSILITSVLMAFFFRSLKITFFSLIVVIIGLLSSLGTVYSFGFQLNLLLGLIPPIIAIIGVPNCIFLINKYREEYSIKSNQKQALVAALKSVGFTLFLANLTTSIGFAVFCLTGSEVLSTFGLVSSLNIFITYWISITFIPIILSYQKPPKPIGLSVIGSKRTTTILNTIDQWVHSKRKQVYWSIGGILFISIIGITKIQSVGYVVDDLREDHPIIQDLRFLERHFKGVIPFEIMVNSGEKNGVLKPEFLYKLKKIEQKLKKYPELSQPISLVQIAKFSYQGYRGGDPKYFVLPGITELSKLTEYQTSIKGKQEKANPFLDSTRKITRISYQIADAGSNRVSQIIDQVQPLLDSTFTGKAKAIVTGGSVIFAKQNHFLQQNLLESTLEAIILISILMAFLFKNRKMVFIGILPSLIPLIITSGLMGYFSIALKPSTILIFSVAFGISSDGTIYFITRFREEIQSHSPAKAISNTIKSTGLSMIYTAFILFFGFSIFIFSTFKGTIALGMLVSITLLMSMICNLILLPSFILTVENIGKKDLGT